MQQMPTKPFKPPLSVTHPDVAAQWHPDKNSGVTPDQVVAGSHKKYWWVCPVAPDHIWHATADNRTGNGTGCPCCSGRQASITNSLAALFPDVADQLDPDRNDGVTPDQIVAGSNKKYWWVCPVAPDHIWHTAASNRTSNSTGCPCCAGQQASITNSLASLFTDVAAQLHPDRNNGVSADQIVAGSHKKYWWVCPVAPDHIWHTAASNRTSNGNGCACCRGFHASVTNSLASLFPDVADQLDPDRNNGVTADQIVAGSHKKYWWVCPVAPDHIWHATASSRTRIGNGCPCCSDDRSPSPTPWPPCFPTWPPNCTPTGITARPLTRSSQGLIRNTCGSVR